MQKFKFQMKKVFAFFLILIALSKISASPNALTPTE